MARTRYQRGDQADSDCANASDVNKPLLSTQTGGNETVSATVSVGMNADVIGFYMASGDPGGEDLGAGSLFRVQFDVTAMGANLTGDVQFHAFDATCTSLGSVSAGTFTGVGLKLLTATWDPPAASDRYGVLVDVDHGGMHNDADETITLRTNNANAFYEIPDAPTAAVQPHFEFRVPAFA